MKKIIAQAIVINHGTEIKVIFNDGTHEMYKPNTSTVKDSVSEKPKRGKKKAVVTTQA